MSMDIYSSSDKKNPLVSLSGSDIRSIEKAISMLKEKTGVYLDPYGTTKIYPDHGKILLSIIVNNKEKTKTIMRFMDIINEYITKNDILIFEGD